MKIRIVQLGVREELAANRARIEAAIDSAQADEWVVFPEGVLSGYFPERPDYTARLDAGKIATAIDEIERLVRARGCNCLLGTALPSAAGWHNSVILLTSTGDRHIHHKVELSALDRQVFAPGTAVTPYSVGGLKLGLQACRELLFPQTWGDLKAAGVQIVFHLNNAIQPHDALWEHILITRAIEQSIFVCSVNNGQEPQGLASYLIAPSGRVVLKTEVQRDQALAAEIDLNEVIPDLSRRTDY
ncbi:MAG: carbon-nitrogen hydrolase family protein [Acidobacteria bacterium]|nr:carbon-nitrogen hydrolase family protein [Acidobacteriota bacterium]